MTVLASKFWTHVDKGQGCWLWTGQTDRYGYGRTSYGKYRTVKAHRLAYFLVEGDWPDGPLDHLCRVRTCVRPDHLEQVSVGENVRRGLLGGLRTHCKRGHELTPDNVTGAFGRKWCLTCQRARQQRWRAGRRLLPSHTDDLPDIVA